MERLKQTGDLKNRAHMNEIGFAGGMANYKKKRFRVDISYILMHFGLKPLKGLDNNIPPTQGVVKMLEHIPPLKPKIRQRLNFPLFKRKVEELTAGGNEDLLDNEKKSLNGLKMFVDKYDSLTAALSDNKIKIKKVRRNELNNKSGAEISKNPSGSQKEIKGGYGTVKKKGELGVAILAENRMKSLGGNMESYALKYVSKEYKTFESYDQNYPKLNKVLNRKRREFCHTEYASNKIGKAPGNREEISPLEIKSEVFDRSPILSKYKETLLARPPEGQSIQSLIKKVEAPIRSLVSIRVDHAFKGKRSKDLEKDIRSVREKIDPTGHKNWDVGLIRTRKAECSRSMEVQKLVSESILKTREIAKEGIKSKGNFI